MLYMYLDALLYNNNMLGRGWGLLWPPLGCVCCLLKIPVNLSPVLPTGKINTFITKELVPKLYQQRNSANGQQQFAV